MLEQLLRLIFGGFGGGGAAPGGEQYVPSDIFAMGKLDEARRRAINRGISVPIEDIRSDLGDPMATILGIPPEKLLPSKGGLQRFGEHQRIWRTAKDIEAQAQDLTKPFTPPDLSWLMK